MQEETLVGGGFGFQLSVQLREVALEPPASSQDKPGETPNFIEVPDMAQDDSFSPLLTPGLQVSVNKAGGGEDSMCKEPLFFFFLFSF